MAGPALIARQILSWALRGTKQLSPVKTTKIANLTSKHFPHKTGTGFGAKKIAKTTTQSGKIRTDLEYRDWVKKVAIGEKSWLANLGIGEVGRGKTVLGYTKGYKHLRKHKKLYAAGGAGAAIWDFLPGKDNA